MGMRIGAVHHHQPSNWLSLPPLAATVLPLSSWETMRSGSAADAKGATLPRSLTASPCALHAVPCFLMSACHCFWSFRLLFIVK